MTNYEKILRKIISAEELLKSQVSGKMVFTNGCFDIIHQGHIGYLAKAAEMGDYLVIGLNSDQSVSRLKGSGKPIQSEESRAIILASLFFVDYIIIFTEDTPGKLIEKLLPEVLVKGGDYTAEEIVGYETVKSKGGEVRIIEFLEGFSSSNILGRIKK